MARLPDESRIRAWQGVMRIHDSVSAALEEALLETSALPLPWYQVLVELRLAGGSLRMHQLAEVATLSRSGTTRFVDRMEEAGLVERRVCPLDRRGLEVVLTEKGSETQRRAAPSVLRGVQEHFGRHLTDEQASLLADTLEGVVQADRRS
ncbi:MAG: MarR family transcriptional regulator [Acidimicrobiia bacterium]|nr:MarR family transcriptional regulator [Acidimicrobiia bacterium]